MVLIWFDFIEFKNSIEKGVYSIEGHPDVNTPASLLKQWLRDLPEPLITSDFYDQSLNIGKMISENTLSIPDSFKHISKIVQKMPRSHRQVINFLKSFLKAS